MPDLCARSSPSSLQTLLEALGRTDAGPLGAVAVHGLCLEARPDGRGMDVSGGSHGETPGFREAPLLI